MTTILALPKLFEDVQAVFAEDYAPDPCPVVFRFGWREPVRQDTQGKGRANRIVFVPGDPGGLAGEDQPAKWPGRVPVRPLITMLERFQVFVWAYEGGAKAEDELAQYTAARLLYDAFRRACYLAARQTFRVVTETWLIEKEVRRLGAELRLVCTIEAMIPDSPSSAMLVQPVESSTVVRLGDASESVHTP